MKNIVKVERARRNMSQAELAEAIYCNRHTINAIETQRYIPNAIIVMRIARFFKVPVEELFKLEADELKFDEKFNDRFEE